jgi:hypothetical protein
MWVVERDGRAVAILTDPQWEDMFWTSYRIEPLGGDHDERAAILSDGFWHDEFLDRTRYRNQAAGWYSWGWWAAPRTGVVRDGRIIMRGLYWCESAADWPRYYVSQVLRWFGY